MRKLAIFPLLLSCLFATSACAQEFVLTSPVLQEGDTLTEAQVFDGFGCSGQNRSPALQWTPGPAGTKSYALMAYDPDAPTGSGWWHWVVYNLPAGTTALAENAGAADGAALPAGAVQGRTDFGTHAFGGACPPPGDAPHRYVFTVYALGVEQIEVPADASAAMVGFMVHANVLGQASLTARYGR
ncbi:YbhB/YbcL family Raf kinase inhibitor-like protein [Pseudoxanthomonas kalamensis DSM 18571]|uniref:YbhB/YbcL family Raf kinase inhibitor-like protein n=1 Tax=Pseudoxanthomonas kalamensis TaxID=289483 RepID=UPI00139171BD|nr:YbhB/YbcL family Raf kinase inhibitor-like protein [Pseudoxanthomonas kalamensis]KAF1712654.1 YbhB/YbcL family Raf kinase inhibitor-like protein [Pseudoxanthomonas kalamensis DSM 18571]